MMLGIRRGTGSVASSSSSSSSSNSSGGGGGGGGAKLMPINLCDCHYSTERPWGSMRRTKTTFSLAVVVVVVVTAVVEEEEEEEGWGVPAVAVLIM